MPSTMPGTAFVWMEKPLFFLVCLNFVMGNHFYCDSLAF